MTPYAKRKNPATNRMAEDMLLRNMAARTIDSYTYHVDRFATRFGKLPEDLGPEQIREFQLWMIQEKKCSWSSFNQAVCGLRFLYTYTLPRPWVVQMIPSGKPFLIDNVALGQDFCQRFIRKLKLLQRRGELELEGLLKDMQDPLQWAQFTASLLEHDWCVFIERPPSAESTPEHVLKYLARYMTGCPKCQQPMQFVVDTPRPSWRDLFYGPDHHAWFES